MRRKINGTKLRERREALGLSLSDLAKHTHTVKGHLSDIENSLTVPSVALALDVAAVLETSVEALFGTGTAPPIKPELVEAFGLERAARAALRILDGALRRDESHL